MNWYFLVLSKYAQFQGRSRRKEFWFFTLINALISMACSLVDTTLQLPTLMEGYGVLAALYAVFAFIPTVAVTVRRLHDQDRTGWWALIMLIPLLVFWFCFILWCKTVPKAVTVLVVIQNRMIIQH